ncbi:MAG: ABC transporter substrate-binding protein [Pseudomonadota bacterium]|jgi:NitT/TauT family transport system substrate-binding protein
MSSASVHASLLPHLTRRRLLLAAGAALLAGCGGRQQVAPLRLGSNEWPGYAPLHLARERGYWGDAPLRLYELTSSSEVLRALRNGALDGAALTSDEALSLLADKVEVRVALVLDISHGGDALVARPEIRRLADLKGRRIGVENQALGAYMLTRALAQGGLAPADVSVVPLTVDTHINAYIAGAVDAVVTFEPVLSRLQAMGAHQLFSSRQTPGEIFDLLVVREEAYRQHRATLKTLSQAWFRVLDEFKAAPAEVAAALGRRTQSSGPELLKALDGLVLPDRQENLNLLTGATPAIAAPLQRLVTLMQERQLLSHGVAPLRLLPADLAEVLAP